MSIKSNNQIAREIAGLFPKLTSKERALLVRVILIALMEKDKRIDFLDYSMLLERDRAENAENALSKNNGS